MNRPLLVVEVKNRVNRNEIHVGLIERINRTDVTPVTCVAFGSTRHAIAREIIDVCLILLHKVRNNVTAHIVRGIGIFLVILERLNQVFGGEYVVTHGCKGHLRVIRGSRRIGWLFDKVGNVTVFVGLNTAKGRCLRTWNPNARNRDGFSRGNMFFHHLLGVHAVDMVRTKNNDVLRVFIVNEVKGLQNGICRTSKPPLTQPLLSRNRGDVLPCKTGKLPRLRNVTVKRMGLVLGKHANLHVPGIHQVR